MAAGYHLLDLIGTVLDLSKIEAGRYELQQTTFDLAALIESQVAIMRPIAPERGNRLRAEIAEPGLTLTADRQLVAQMILNLLSNALKFTTDGTVTVRAWGGRLEDVKILVEDDGCGIPADAVASLGEAFYQGPQDSRTAVRGAGLGLSIVKQMVELHGGTLEIESAEGVGTRVTLSFPTAPPAIRRRSA